MTKPALHIDIAIVGGGIAGLWLLNLLRNSGYSAVLFEQSALGSQQTGASQGIIHSGIKYALAGAPCAGSPPLEAMPAAWRDCLHGKGRVDLAACRILSEHFYLFSSMPLPQQRSAFLTGRAERSRMEKLSAAEYPAPFRTGNFRGHVYRLEEPVLDVPSLLRTLADQQSTALFSIDWDRATLHNHRQRASLELPRCIVHPQCLLLTAGSGNEALIARLGATTPRMQRRPLQQVCVKHQYQTDIFGHWIGTECSPRLTITSHRTAAGEPLWSLGGDLASSSARDCPQQTIARAQRELAQLLPWLNLGNAQWCTLPIDRAEPYQRYGLRPGQAFIGALDSVENALAVWPTKLALCPALGDELQQLLHNRNIRPRYQPDLAMLHGAGRPPLAAPCHESPFP